MNTARFMQQLFDGYALCFRRLGWHKSSNYSDLTAVSLGFFAELGQHLGYTVRREMNYDYPRDLCWCEGSAALGQGSYQGGLDSTAKTVLYLEHETQNSRVLPNTIEKMLNPANAATVPYLVAVLGWVRSDTLKQAKEIVRAKLPPHQHLLLISWIGETQDGDSFKIEGWLCSGQTEYRRPATPLLDDCGYWYIKPDGDWQTQSGPGSLAR